MTALELSVRAVLMTRHALRCSSSMFRVRNALPSSVRQWTKSSDQTGLQEAGRSREARIVSRDTYRELLEQYRWDEWNEPPGDEESSTRLRRLAVRAITEGVATPEEAAALLGVKSEELAFIYLTTSRQVYKRLPFLLRQIWTRNSGQGQICSIVCGVVSAEKEILGGYVTLPHCFYGKRVRSKALSQYKLVIPKYFDDGHPSA